MIEPMTQEEKKRFVEIHNISFNYLNTAIEARDGGTYNELIDLRKKIRLLDDPEAFALEGARSWGGFLADMNRIKGGK
jgi:hypothetical protein